MMFVACSPISLFFLIYSYAIMMNGKAVDIFNQRNNQINKIVDAQFNKDLQKIIANGPTEGHRNLAKMSK
jgi:hypothetical protein